MKSGLGDRNNEMVNIKISIKIGVSMKSGLGDRNNSAGRMRTQTTVDPVSMKSGLGDRNN